jgi:heme oxygenase
VVEFRAALMLFLISRGVVVRGDPSRLMMSLLSRRMGLLSGGEALVAVGVAVCGAGCGFVAVGFFFFFFAT